MMLLRHGRPASDAGRITPDGPLARAAQPAVNRTVLLLAAVAILMQTLSMVAGVQVMGVYGAAFEMNPLAQMGFAFGGAMGAAATKVIVVVGGVLLFVEMARSGRIWLAETFLGLSATMGLVSFVAKVL